MADERIIMASAFEAKCFAPIDQGADRRSTDGSVTVLVDDDEALFSAGSTWDAIEAT